MNDSLRAAAPEANASVHASAGTGKTWLLVTRIIRLLLDGARPDGILAVTFTRKAAAEMQERLQERLREFMTPEDAELDRHLEQIGLVADPELRGRARRLYEDLLYSEHPLRTATFHAFCQEVLTRFPLEAGVAAGFDLLETTGALSQEAWEALFAESTREPDGVYARALETLFEQTGGLFNTRTTLLSFLEHRSDWWAYTADQPAPVEYAIEQLATGLGIRPGDDPLTGFPSPRLRQALEEFTGLLALHPNKTNTGHRDTIHNTLSGAQTAGQFLEEIGKAFLTAKREPRARKESKVQAEKMGNEGQARFLELHRQVCDLLLQAYERLARQATLELSTAWYLAGARLLEHFQRLKQEQRILDFSDLEWKAYELLSTADNAHWVQYKLDQRIDHLLIDEFQDTNPTQWRLILPLLEELAAGSGERKRSVFLVGDNKQSIYRFRRANPALLGTAAEWLEDRLQATSCRLDASRRSAPAIIDCINTIFGTGVLHERLPAFHTHATHLGDLWGRVEVLPLIEAQETGSGIDPGQGLRNPLLAPRILEEDQRHYREGRQITRRIRELVDGGTLIGPEKDARPVGYDDITILLRSRTHVEAYERALQEANIPYLGADRGTLLENLEVRDLEALLNTLISPYDNLALAQVLRSPLFAASDEDLVRLAQGEGSWIDRLATIASQGREEDPLRFASRQLEGWRSLVGQIPVHDLLDRIFHEGNVIERYESAFPPALAPRLQANLTRFIELALEMDSGRYPSLPHFLQGLQQLRRHEQDRPDAAPPASSSGGRVRILTIHAAKGLEAPVIFLADSAARPGGKKAWHALIDWPATDDRPAHFHLAGKPASQDSLTRALLETQDREELREETNLLYVALTRARQLLYISGCAPVRGSNLGWYGQIREQLCAGGEPAIPESLILETGRMPEASTRTVQTRAPEPEVDSALSRTLHPARAYQEISPSLATVSGGALSGDPDGLQRGIAIHRMLQLLNELPAEQAGSIPARVAQETGREPDGPDLRSWWEEASATYRDPALAGLFDPVRYQQAWNEVPIQYQRDETTVYGIIDRLLVREDEVQVIDYKSHRKATAETVGALAGDYRDQLRLYADGVARIWPEKKISTLLLFTACRLPVEVER